MFDLDSIETTDTSFLHLKHPATEEPIVVVVDGAKVPAGITFHAPGSDAYEAAVSKRTNRALHRSKRKIDVTADLLRSDQITFLTEVTKSFEHLGFSSAGEVSGETLFNAVYADRSKGWLVEQANAHLADWASFTKGSAKI